MSSGSQDVILVLVVWSAIGGVAWRWFAKRSKEYEEERQAILSANEERRNFEKHAEKQLIRAEKRWNRIQKTGKHSWKDLTRQERRDVVNRASIEHGNTPFVEVDWNLTLITARKRFGYVVKCYICGEPVMTHDSGWGGTRRDKPTSAQLDHIVPLAKGGTHTWDNVAFVHKKCNSKKGTSSTRKMIGRIGPPPNNSPEGRRRDAEKKRELEEFKRRYDEEYPSAFLGQRRDNEISDESILPSKPERKKRRKGSD